MRRKSQPPSSSSIREIKDLLEMFSESGVDELELEKEGWKIHLKKGGGGTHTIVSMPHQAPMAIPNPTHVPVPPPPPPTAGQAVSAPMVPSVPAETAGVSIAAPMVGTFYRSSDPDAPPFVQSGDTVSEGQVLCIIEAMKLMNEIKAEFRCKILSISVENGQTIEFGQPLFQVEKLS